MAGLVSEIVLNNVPVGPAATFRGTINDNFTAIDTQFDQVYTDMVDVVLAPVSSGGSTPDITYTQKEGDIWLKELS